MTNVSAHDLKPEDIDALTDLLLDCELSKDDWGSISAELPKHIGSNFDESQKQRIRIRNLVEKSLEFPDGIEGLLSRVRYWTERSSSWIELARSPSTCSAGFSPILRNSQGSMLGKSGHHLKLALSKLAHYYRTSKWFITHIYALALNRIK